MDENKLTVRHFLLFSVLTIIGLILVFRQPLIKIFRVAFYPTKQIAICASEQTQDKDPCDYVEVFDVENEERCNKVGGFWGVWETDISKGEACFVEEW